jgi:RND family efflux transporter MFP subunit
MKPYPIWKQLGIVTLIALVCLTGWYGHAPAVSFLAERGWIDAQNTQGGERQRRRGDRPIPVIVARAASANNDAVLIAVGTARAQRTATLYPQGEGIVSALEVKAGDTVAKGDVILRLDPAKAELAVAVAKQKVAQAERMRDRAAYLNRRSVQSTAKLDDTQNSLDVAKLELKLAEEALADTVVAAPFAGIVSLPEVELGDRVTSSTRVASIDDRSKVLIEFEVPEVYFGRLERGMPATATTAAYRGRTFEGALSTIDARINTETRTVRVRAVFPNADDTLRPGMSFTAQLKFPGQSYTAVPELALQYDDGRPFVWRVEDGRAARVAVRPVRRSNASALIEGPIAPGDLVVVEGVQRVRQGRALKFDTPPTDPADGSDAVSGRPTAAAAGKRG